MGKIILYGKIGRSMPLTLDKCGVAGGDQEMTAVVSSLAKRHPEDTFVLIGRNSGEHPASVGLPENVVNPWFEFGNDVKKKLADADLKGNFTPDDQLRYAEIVDRYTMPWFESADAVIMWAGQHGTSNNPIPKVGDRTQLTKPQDSFTHYAGFLLRGINQWRDVDPVGREEVWLNADPRNYLKMRDLKWPLRHPVLAQFDYHTNIKHERYGAGSTGWDQFHSPSVNPLWEHMGYEEYGQVWKAKVRSTYSRLELNLTVPGTPSGDYLTFNDHWGREHDFGIVINEARAIGVKPTMTRLHALKEWVLPLDPGFIYGTWSAKSLDELGEWKSQIKPIEWRQYTHEIQRTRCTFTTPSSGSGWATTKPWESFALGTVCFFHPSYDTQNHILKDAHPKLMEWLRVKTPGDLKARVEFLGRPEGRAMWEWLVVEQRRHYEQAVTNPKYLQLIEDRIYGSHL